MFKFLSNNNRNPIEQFILVSKFLRYVNFFYLLEYYLHLFKNELVARKFEAQSWMKVTIFQQLCEETQKKIMSTLWEWKVEVYALLVTLLSLFLKQNFHP